MLTKEKITDFAIHFESETGRNGFIAGATWANNENAEEITELVTALRELNAIIYSNFGVKHPAVTQLIKKYEK